ncbi:carboxypeptidase regulatory-like domain-containing protein [Stigmatella sp. ncwal1]|uniref:Carboxypeptidase regulatory-like domain-containing protein n=1 Tax=Stigmatella ashevillensis TaxID=2995309 RepID=A0ABT5CZS2_9BACT|nr:carboxypeptidase regulatory-like domain-containing protein [Stigmatella ashevillena]MDC0706932.1 carboxypeptidase regulatory-like domain-containing protein [Stigmatella ashevillena]
MALLPARPGRYLVSARAGNFATARADVLKPQGEAVTAVRLTLAAGGALEGSVVNKASQGPVPLAELVLTPRGLSMDERASAPQEERFSASSNERGSFRFDGLAPGEYQLEARAPGHSPKRLSRVHVPSSGITIEMEASAFIEGFVELSEGSPAALAHVSAFGAEEAILTETGAGGGFSLDVPPGSYQLTAQKGGKTGSTHGKLVVGAGMTLQNIRIRLGASTAIEGVVRQKDSGLPIAHAVIAALPSSEGGEVEVGRASSNPEGRFEVAGLAPGAYDVRVRAQGFKALHRAGITLLEGQRFELLAELASNGRIEGTVTGSAKQPLAGVHVSPQRKWGPLEGAGATVTNEEGHFALEDVPPGDVYVAARRPGSDANTRVPVKVESGKTSRVQLQLSDEGTLEGTVRLLGGRLPTRPVTVYAKQVEAPRSEGLEVPATAEGTFSIRAGAGRYQLSAWLVDARSGNDQEKIVTLEADQRQHVDLEVREGTKPITVTVLEPNGAPSVRATVMGCEAGQSNILLEDLTDESGQVTLRVDSLGADLLHLWATNGGRSGDLPRVSSGSTRATLQLSPGARLTGTVRSAGGRAVDGFQLVVAAIRTGEDFFSQQKFEFTGDRFHVEDVAPGRLSVTATLPDGRAGKAEAAPVSGSAAHVEIVVEAGGGLKGRLLDLKSGEPIPQAFVEVDGLVSPTTGPDGRFQLDDIAPGPHRATAWERQHGIADKQVNILPGKVLELGDWYMASPPVEPGRLGLAFGMSGEDVIIRWISAGAGTGVQIGDVITAIDGATVLTPGEARQRELGPPGSPATLSLRRGTQRHTVTLIRAGSPQ